MTNDVSGNVVGKATPLSYLLHRLKISTIYDFIFYAMVFTAPLVVYGISIFGVSLRLSRLFIILIMPFMFFKVTTKPGLILRDKFLVFGIVPFLLFTTLSIGWSPGDSVGFSLNRLVALHEVMFVYVIFAVADLNVGRFQSFIKCYVLSALIPLGISFWQIANNMFQFSTAEIPFQNLLIAGKYENLSEHCGRIANEFSRISATFAEPTIFGSYMCSVLLLSLLVECKNELSVIALRIFQISVFLSMILSLSKLAVLIFIVGIIVILRKQKVYLVSFIIGLSLFIAVLYLLLSYYNLDFVAKRFLTDSGHIELIKSTVMQFRNINLVIGDGIGSIPRFTSNKFLLSRIYESGVIGVVFTLYVSGLPFMILYQRVYTCKFNKIKNICVGVIFAVLFGMHLYDYFIYLWPWIVIGSIMSLYNNDKEIITA